MNSRSPPARIRELIFGSRAQPAGNGRRWSRVAADIAQPVAALVVFVLLWELACRTFSIPAYLVPAPSRDLGRYMEARRANVGMHTLATTQTMLLGFFASLIVSLPLAVLLTSSPLIANTLYPLLVLTQSIPKVALAPILVVIFGSNELPRVVVTFLVAFFPLVLSIAAGITSVPPELIELGRACRASRWRELWRIRLPYAVPFIFSGLKAAITLSVVGAVVAEFVNADRGLGYLIVTSTAFFKVAARLGRADAALDDGHHAVPGGRDHRARVLSLGGRRRQANSLRGRTMPEKRATIIRGGRLIDAGAPAPKRPISSSSATVSPKSDRRGWRLPPTRSSIDAQRPADASRADQRAHARPRQSGKGMGDRWTLELLLAAGPWITGGRTLEDKYLTTYVGAIEMLLKGCTACYDLTVEFPLPSVEGLEACGRAYADAGMRAVLAPMVAEFSFYEAIPGLMDALPPALQKEVERLRLAPGDATLAAMRQSMHGWKFDRASVRPAVAPTIPHHCSDDFMRKCAALAREFDVGLHSHVQESKVQAIVGRKRYGKTPTAHLQDLGSARAGLHGRRTASGSTMTTCSAWAITAPRSRTIPAATCVSATALPMCGRCWSAR